MRLGAPPKTTALGRLRAALARTSFLTAAGALFIPLSLFLSWFEITAGAKQGNYTGWYSFHRTDRVLAALALIALASSVLPPSRRAAVARTVVGLVSVAMVAREMVGPPIFDPTLELRAGGYLGLAGSVLVVLGGLVALDPVRRALAVAPRRTVNVVGRIGTGVARAFVWFRGDPEPVRGEAAPSRSLGQGVLRGIPRLSPGGFGLFRISFGLGLVWIMTSYAQLSHWATPADEQQGTSWFVQGDLVRWAASSPHFLAAVSAATVVALAFFVAGLLSHAAYAIAALGLAASATAIVAVGGGAHDWGLPVVTALALLIVPWGESGLGVDALIRRRRGRALPDAPSRRYGLAVWIPGLTVGVGLAAAAYAKLSNSGLAWITEGAVKYHFVEDAGEAPLDWGLRLTSVDEIAVLMSLAAVTIEAAFILVTLSSRPTVRLAFGLVAVAMLTGFWLFQGVFWPTWWVLFLALLPWEQVYRAALRAVARGSEASLAPAGPIPLEGPLRIVTLALVVVLVAQQAVASAGRVEQEPFVSNFPMYSAAWASEEEFNAANSKFLHYRFERRDERGRRVDITAQIAALRGTELLERAHEAREGDPLTDKESSGLRRGVRSVGAAFQARYGEALERVYVVAERQAGFDFERAQFDRRVVRRTTHVIAPNSFQVASVGS